MVTLVKFSRWRCLRFVASVVSAVCFLGTAQGQVLFDATKAEMAGNADWVIDADTHDLSVQNGDGSGARGGSDSNPQRVPTPALSGITSTTLETYWQGALSAFAVALAKRGQTVIETLPVFVSPTSTTRSRITYNDSTNVQDLTRYKLFVVCEPNIYFTAAEKTAVLTWVKNGGSLFMVADHTGSDRNGDGSDAVQVWNDLLNTNTVQTKPFGFTFNADDVSPTETVDSTATNPLSHGPAGTVTQFEYADGATMTITDTTVAHPAVWQSSKKLSTQVMALYGTFGAGRFVAIGDSSPMDDGTGDSHDTLYDGWDDGAGGDGALITNGALWLLAAPPTATTIAASAVQTTTTTLNGSVNPQAQTTTAFFQYGLTTSYGSATTSQTVGSGSASVAINAALTGLSTGTTYHYRVVATNATGITNGADMTFTTSVPAPSAMTVAASGVASSQAAVNANVNPQGITTTFHFDFGTTTAYGFSSVEKTVGSGASSVAVALPIVGLAPGTTYHYRVVITSANGVVAGADLSFTTTAFVDSDGDGIPDDYESAHGLNAHDATDAALDLDGDGKSNLAEYLAGTDPANPTDSFQLSSARSISGADMFLSFKTIFAKRYVVERTTDLTNATWTTLGSTINGNGASQSFTDAGVLQSTTQYFYRVRIIP